MLRRSSISTLRAERAPRTPRAARPPPRRVPSGGVRMHQRLRNSVGEAGVGPGILGAGHRMRRTKCTPCGQMRRAPARRPTPSPSRHRTRSRPASDAAPIARATALDAPTGTHRMTQIGAAHASAADRRDARRRVRVAHARVAHFRVASRSPTIVSARPCAAARHARSTSRSARCR